MDKGDEYVRGLQFAVKHLMEGLKENVQTLDRAHNHQDAPREDVAFLRGVVRTYAESAAVMRAHIDEATGFDGNARVQIHRVFKQAQREANELKLKMLVLASSPSDAEAVAEELENKEREADGFLVKAAIADPTPKSTLMN